MTATALFKFNNILEKNRPLQPVFWKEQTTPTGVLKRIDHSNWCFEKNRPLQLVFWKKIHWPYKTLIAKVALKVLKVAIPKKLQHLKRKSKGVIQKSRPQKVAVPEVTPAWKVSLITLLKTRLYTCQNGSLQLL